MANVNELSKRMADAVLQLIQAQSAHYTVRDDAVREAHFNLEQSVKAALVETAFVSMPKVGD